MRVRLPLYEVNGEVRGESEWAGREIDEERKNIHAINQYFPKRA